eukprot:jgi/Chlat1/6535/Chrsp45S06074
MLAVTLYRSLVPYRAALKLLEELAALRRKNEVCDQLLVLQHEPVYTVGKRATTHNLLVSEEELASRGAELVHTRRGGDITFHGPGQWLLYPTVKLKERQLGARQYVEALEDTMITTAAEHGIGARGRMKLETGVWVEDRKIGAIGVQISAGVASHGLAFNACPNLRWYNNIVPCGIAGKEVTSLQKELGRDIDMHQVGMLLMTNFFNHLRYNQMSLIEARSLSS